MRAPILLLFFLLLYAPLARAQEFNAGIVQGLWYAEEVVFAETPTRIYVAIRNNTGSDLSGIVEFFDGEKKIGRKNVQALDGRIIESWTDWMPSYGNHTLKATLTRTELHQVGEQTQEIGVVSAIAEDTLFVDYDTDKDGIGNETDTDDDADGISDQREKEQGTDPLIAQIDSNETTEENEVIDDTEEETPIASEMQEPRGIERYLAPSPAESVFSRATHIINQAKEDLDIYRQARKDKAEIAKENDYTNGFGEVTVASSTEAGVRDINLSDFFVSVWNLAKTILNFVYTFVLALLSFMLGHPILVQLGILVLLLLFVVKLAQKFGKRPKKF